MPYLSKFVEFFPRLLRCIRVYFLQFDRCSFVIWRLWSIWYCYLAWFFSSEPLLCDFLWCTSLIYQSRGALQKLLYDLLLVALNQINNTLAHNQFKKPAYLCRTGVNLLLVSQRHYSAQSSAHKFVKRYWKETYFATRLPVNVGSETFLIMFLQQRCVNKSAQRRHSAQLRGKIINFFSNLYLRLFSSNL